MGYRSDWTIVIEGEPDKLLELLAWMKQQIQMFDPQKNIYAGPDLMKEIYETKEIDLPCGTLSFSGNGWKCYAPWDSIKDDILQKCRDELGLDAAYVRIGEAYEDIDVCQGEEIMIDISRSMEIDMPLNKYQWPPLKEGKNGQLEMPNDDGN